MSSSREAICSSHQGWLYKRRTTGSNQLINQSKGKHLHCNKINIIYNFSDLHLPNVPSSTSVVDIDVQSQSQLSPHRDIRNPVSTNTHKSPNSVPKTPSTSPVMIQSPNNVSRSPGTSPSQISQINLYKQSPVLDNLENMCRSSEEFDLSLELPDVPSFTPTFDKHKREACLDT